MKQKILVIMRLVNMSCGCHTDGRTNLGVTELIGEQKEDLQKMYGMYRFSPRFPIFRKTPLLNLFCG